MKIASLPESRTLFIVKCLPIVFAVAVAFVLPTIVNAQSQGWAQRDFRSIHGGILDRQVNPLPATRVFPEDIPQFTYDGSQPIFRLSQQTTDSSLPAEILPPELNSYPIDIQGQTGVFLDEDQIFLSRPVLAEHKPGYLKTVSLDSTWVAGSGDNLGMTDVLATASFGLPHPTRPSPLIITPGYGMHFLVGPDSLQAPATLYDVYLTTRWMSKLNERWGILMSFTAGYYTDFQINDRDALRLSGMAFTSYEWSPELQLIMGVVYLNRDDYNILPGVGLVWSPTENRRLELIFPRPRYLQLWDFGPNFEDWWYISGEVGGGTWAVEHPIDSKDFLTLTDYRLIIGLERKRNGGGKSFLEIGYVFGRKFEYRNDPSELDMDGTVMLRSGWWF